MKNILKNILECKNKCSMMVLLKNKDFLYILYHPYKVSVKSCVSTFFLLKKINFFTLN
jgi:hypothetical protein